MNQSFRDLFQFQFREQPPDPKLEPQNREALISKVRNYWVNGVLENSLGSKAIIELGLIRDNNVIERPFNLDWVTPQQSRTSLPPGTKVIDLFNQMGEGGTLLILGKPGSGKTITLLGLARDLLACAQQNEQQPIPVVFNLSSWQDNYSIADWLIQELQEKYQVPKTVGKNWLKEQKLLLLLDGLDEVRENLRDNCVLTLNKFIQDYGNTKTIVCSRVDDYKALSAHLKFQSAIFIEPLTTQQINHYLDQAGQQLARVRDAIKLSPILQELVKTPLMLSVISLTYTYQSDQENFSRDLPQVTEPKEYLKLLFNDYIKRMLFRRQKVKLRYTEKQTKDWLSWLASRTVKESQSIFLIEGMQPSWLGSGLAKYFYCFLKVLIVGLSPYLLLQFFREISITDISSILIFIVFAIIIATFQFFKPDQIQTVEILNISSLNLIVFAKHMLITVTSLVVLLYLIFGVPFQLVSDSENRLPPGIEQLVIPILVFYLIFLLIFKREFLLETVKESCQNIKELFCKLVKSSHDLIFSKKLEKTSTPNQGIKRSIKNIFLLLGIALFFIVIGLFIQNYIMPQLKTNNDLANIIIYVLFFIFCLAVSILELVISLSICNAILVLIKHFLLRFILHFQGYIPWNYADFLEYTVERIFLQRVGGGYIFIHRSLQEHFANQVRKQKL